MVGNIFRRFFKNILKVLWVKVKFKFICKGSFLKKFLKVLGDFWRIRDLIGFKFRFCVCWFFIFLCDRFFCFLFRLVVFERVY